MSQDDLIAVPEDVRNALNRIGDDAVEDTVDREAFERLSEYYEDMLDAHDGTDGTSIVIEDEIYSEGEDVETHLTAAQAACYRSGKTLTVDIDEFKFFLNGETVQIEPKD